MNGVSVCSLRFDQALKISAADGWADACRETDGPMREGDDVREHIPELYGYEAVLAALRPGDTMPWRLERVARGSRFVTFEVAAEASGFVLFALDVTREAGLERDLLQSRNENALLNARLQQINAELEDRVASAVEAARRSDLLLIEQSRFALMGEMIANIAHQWRQPLNALSLSLYSLMDAWAYDELDEAFVHDFYEKNAALVQSMSETIDDFRYFFRPPEAPERFDAAQLLQRALKMQSEMLQAHGIRVIPELGREGCTVRGHANQLMQVVLNLVGNAFDALKNVGEAQRWIRVACRRDGGMVRIVVEDGGSGIPSSVQPRIFEPYFTTKGASGTGLGLYMTRIILERNFRGNIVLEPENAGARFVVMLPHAEEEGACR